MVNYQTRPASSADCDVITKAIAISSGGYAQLGWQEKQGDYPGLSLAEIGSRMYARDKPPFTWRNCIVAEADEPLGVMLAYGISAGDGSADSASEKEDDHDVFYPVSMEIQNSWYICGMTVFAAWRGKGIGSHFLKNANVQAKDQAYDQISLIAFAQNEGSVRLYLRNGFSVAESRTIIPHPMLEYTGDALLMVAPVRP